jgi:hypothetical protein
MMCITQKGYLSIVPETVGDIVIFVVGKYCTVFLLIPSIDGNKFPQYIATHLLPLILPPSQSC